MLIVLWRRFFVSSDRRKPLSNLFFLFFPLFLFVSICVKEIFPVRYIPEISVSVMQEGRLFVNKLIVHCDQCGAQNRIQAQYCFNCGERVFLPGDALQQQLPEVTGPVADAATVVFVSPPSSALPGLDKQERKQEQAHGSIVTSIQSDDGTVRVIGSGSGVSDPFTLEYGIARLRIHHDGKKELIVDLLNGDGQLETNFVLRAGEKQVSRSVVLVITDRCVFKVRGGGEWSIEVVQQHRLPMLPVPAQIRGSGEQTSALFKLMTGRATFRLQRENKTSLFADLFNDQGKLVRHMMIAAGQINTMQVINIDHPGMHVLNVRGEGHWTVRVEQ